MVASGGAMRVGRPVGPPNRMPLPSSGLPSGSITRPSQDGATSSMACWRVPQIGHASRAPARPAAVGHRLQGGVAKPDHLGRDQALVAGTQFQPVADRGQTGQSLHLDDEAQQIGDGAADLGGLNAAESRLAGIDSI